MRLVDFIAHGDGASLKGADRPRRRSNGALTRWLDRGAIGLSGLCLVHCLAFPLIILALPAMGEILPQQWWVHPVIFACAVPMALFALVRGFVVHRDRRPLQLGGIGLVLLGLGLLASEGSGVEVVLTVLGGVVLAVAHVLNRRSGTHNHV